MKEQQVQHLQSAVYSDFAWIAVRPWHPMNESFWFRDSPDLRTRRIQSCDVTAGIALRTIQGEDVTRMT